MKKRNLKLIALGLTGRMGVDALTGSGTGIEEAPAGRGSAGSAGASVWDYFAKQDLARSADRST